MRVASGIASALCMVATAAGGQDPAPPPRSVLILVSGSASAYLQADAGVTAVLRDRAPRVAVATISMEGPTGSESARRALDAGASLVVAIGTKASQLASRAATDTPLIYAMVLDPASVGLPPPGSRPTQRITGVAMDVTFSQQFALMRELLPRFSKIGVLYDPIVSGDAVRRASEAAKAEGLMLVAQAVRTESEVLDAVSVIAPEVDILWAIADPTVLTPLNARALILFSLRSRKPMFAISEGYVRTGALAALAAQPYEVGRRAGEMAASVLSGSPVTAVKPEMPPSVAVFLNRATARHLGLDLPESAIARASAIYPQP